MTGAVGTKSMESKPSVILSGTAKDAADAPPLGLVDIGENQRAYIFRVSLPGVCKPQCNLKLDISADGRVEISGLIRDSEFISTHATNKYKPKVQQLAALGNFNISFNLPGRVDPRLVSPTFLKTGILEVVVVKHTIPNNQPKSNDQPTPNSQPKANNQPKPDNQPKNPGTTVSSF